MVVQGARKNGMNQPLHAFQVSSWVLFLFFVAFFYALQFLYTDVVGRAVAGTLYAIFTVITVVAAGFATVTDPADAHIYEAEQQYHPREVVPGRLYCYRCERHVRDTSKHCTLCQKCIDGFDHHCIWLNNCVGKHNYRAFLVLLVGAAGLLSLQIGYGIYVIVKYGVNVGDFNARVRSFYPNLSGGTFFGLDIAVTVLGVVALALVLQLVSFHAYLISHKLSTYDYIMAKAREHSASLAAAGNAPPSPGSGSTRRSKSSRGSRRAAGEAAPETAVTAEAAPVADEEAAVSLEEDGQTRTAQPEGAQDLFVSPGGPPHAAHNGLVAAGAPELLQPSSGVITGGEAGGSTRRRMSSERRHQAVGGSVGGVEEAPTAMDAGVEAETDTVGGSGPVCAPDRRVSR